MTTRRDVLIAPPAARWRLVCLAGAALFVVLALASAGWTMLPGDAPLRDAVLALASPTLVAGAHAVNHLGSWRGLLPVMVALLALSREARRRWWLWCGVLVLTSGLETLFKHLVARARPEEHSMGFPSGHASAVAAAGVLVIYLALRQSGARRLRIAVPAVAVAAILLVGLARIVLRAHWPSDVVGGWALGTACAAAAAAWDAARDREPLVAPSGRGQPVTPASG